MLFGPLMVKEEPVQKGISPARLLDHSTRTAEESFMEKIGRNDPCPCGSGKKFKKCCINKINEVIERARMGVPWHTEEVDGLKTKDIISRLQGMGIHFDESAFREDVKRFYSASELSQYWLKKMAFPALDLDEDFVWMACVVLWKRLAPDVMNTEQLDDLMQEGYQLVHANDSVVDGCKLWLQVWEHLKERFTTDMKTIDDAEKVFSGSQCLYNWCQDLEMELHNAALVDPSFFEKRIGYCTEFCTLFPESDESLCFSMKRGAAESYFSMGRYQDGDSAFRALIAEYPDNVWGYIGWGDMYSLFSPPGRDKDLNKAKEIYEMALNIDSGDKELALRRLESLNEDS